MVTQTRSGRKRSEPTRIIGFAIDVSGSMKGSIQNSSGGQLSSLDAIRGAFDTVLYEASESPHPDNSSVTPKTFIFVYAFGLRIPGIDGCADLLQLFSVKDDIKAELVPPTEHEVKETYREEIERQVSELRREYENRLNGGDRQLAIKLMGLSAAKKLLRVDRSTAEAIVRPYLEERIHQELPELVQRVVVTAIGARIRKRLDADLTLSIVDLRRCWSTLRQGLSTSDEFLGGSTPMCHALRLAEQRFIRERAKHPNAQCTLFVVSDGNITDGNPREIAERIKRTDVGIVTCFVSNQDVLESRRLYKQPNEGKWNWRTDAKVMFHMASLLPASSSEASYLRQSGWDVGRRARMFTQVNHSDLLSEFMRVVISPINSERATLNSARSNEDASRVTGASEITRPASLQKFTGQENVHFSDTHLEVSSELTILPYLEAMALVRKYFPPSEESSDFCPTSDSGHTRGYKDVGAPSPDNIGTSGAHAVGPRCPSLRSLFGSVASRCSRSFWRLVSSIR